MPDVFGLAQHDCNKVTLIVMCGWLAVLMNRD